MTLNSKNDTVGKLKGSRGRNNGQAIIEFIVALIALIPLFLLIPLLGKYLDIKQTTIASSRKLAFECTVRYDDCASLGTNTSFVNEIRTGFFSDNAREILSNDLPAANLVGTTGNPLWVDRGGKSLLDNYADIGIVADQVALNSTSGFVGTLSRYLGPGLFGLQIGDGLYNARVQVKLSQSQTETSFLSQLDSLKLDMQFHTAILTNAWAAKGPGTTADECNAGSNSVIGRVSIASTCNPISRTYDSTIAPAVNTLTTVLADVQRTTRVGEANIGQFRYHTFLTPSFVEYVPNGSDATGYARAR
jgi:hypothetical protein